MLSNLTEVYPLPVSNDHGIPVFADFLAEVQKRYDQEQLLKNAAFSFLIARGLYLEFHKWLHENR